MCVTYFDVHYLLRKFYDLIIDKDDNLDKLYRTVKVILVMLFSQKINDNDCTLADKRTPL